MVPDTRTLTGKDGTRQEEGREDPSRPPLPAWYYYPTMCRCAELTRMGHSVPAA